MRKVRVCSIIARRNLEMQDVSRGRYDPDNLHLYLDQSQNLRFLKLTLSVDKLFPTLRKSF